MARFVCDEKLGVRTISKARDEVLKIFESGEDLSLDMSALRRIDLSVGQFIVAVQKEGKLRGVPVRIAGVTPGVRRQLSLCGVVKWGGNA